MWRKKLMTATAAGMLMATLVTSPALAHGHHRRAAAAATGATVSNYACTVEGCGATGYHCLDGHNYWGCYSVCNVEGCGETGHHTHDGYDYWGCTPVCAVEGCTETGRHTHDGYGYCGYGHNSGYCDSSCVSYSGGSGYCGGHHGCRFQPFTTPKRRRAD